MEVKIQLHVYAYYEHNCPIYRVWINDTLYIEREFWTDCLTNFIEEEIYVELESGEHQIIVEKVRNNPARLWVEKFILTYENVLENHGYGIEPTNKHVIKFNIK